MIPPSPFKRNLRTMKKILLLLLCLPATLAAQNAASDHNFSVAKNLEIFNNLYRELDLYYVDTLNADKNVENAILYMLGRLDPYTEFYNEENTTELKQLTTGKYAGIGSVIVLRRSEGRCIIADPYEGMPAAEAGLRPGDILLAQDGKDYGTAEKGKEGEYSQRVSASLRGTPGTTFELTVKRYGVDKPLKFHLKRRIVTQPSVPFTTLLHDSIGYIQISSYTESTARETRLAVAELKQRGARRIVLDLRENPGGLVDQAVKLVNLFLPKHKEVVSLKGRLAENDATYKTQEEPLDETIPLAVLVNEGTASSAEITSGALQDYDRAVIIGQRTYGKGLVQAPRQLPYNTILKLTTAKYYIPSGRCIQAYDYKDGRPQHLPDSLAKEFHTAAGRTVRDGGGIRPDVEVVPDSLPYLLDYLDTSDALYDYVTDYCNRHPKIAPPAQFRLTEEEYAAFRDFMKKQEFTYSNRSKATLDILRSIAEAEGYATVAEKEFADLEKRLTPGIDHDFTYWEKDIRKLVESRIVACYYYQRGVSEYLLKNDKELGEALTILEDNEAYISMLRP